MTDQDMLDYFAGQALSGMGTWMPPVDILDSEGREIPAHMPSYQRKAREARAVWAYQQAEAMMAERARRTPTADGTSS